MTESYLKNITNQYVLVLGLAKSGTAAARLLTKRGARVTVNEAKSSEQIQNFEDLKSIGIQFVTGGHPLSLLDEKPVYIVKNPGIRYDNPIVEEAQRRGVTVISEIELASEILEGTMIAITGSNGKTTTTTLIEKFICANGQTAEIAGNIGYPASAVAENIPRDGYMVTEVSSFQLKGTRHFRPRIAVLLNIYEAHIDYHGSLLDYEQSKAKIAANLRPEDWLVYNEEDPVVKKIALRSYAQLIPFSVKHKLSHGASHNDGHLYWNGEFFLEASEVALPGVHNLENVLAALACAKLAHVRDQTIINVLKKFGGVEHRLQFVRNLDGRKVYNDSKATNILATSRALAAFEEPIVLIAGGLDRGNDFKALEKSLRNVKGLVTYGETAEKLARTALHAGVTSVIKTTTLEEAVAEAYPLTNNGDVLLLSPACASWDQFKTFEERGEQFIAALDKL